jgi:hypothetical protein
MAFVATPGVSAQKTRGHKAFRRAGRVSAFDGRACDESGDCGAFFFDMEIPWTFWSA